MTVPRHCAGKKIDECEFSVLCGSGLYLESGEHGVRLADDAHNDGTLLDGFLGVFHLKDATLR